MTEKNILPEMIEKYNVPVPRYTSYPPANFFDDRVDSGRYRDMVLNSNNDSPSNISLYIHIPFCPVLCLYCGCNTHITRDEQLKSEYVEAIKQEIRMLRPLLDRNRKVSQLHWGGGTPNNLLPGQIAEIMELLFYEFDFISHPEIAIECNPALLDHDYVDNLLDMKFNRISLGVQDFSEKVLKEVNRAIPEIPVPDFVHQIKTSGKAGVNLDFIYGLPYQTVETFRETISRAAALKPDRLVTFSYAHIPGIKKAQAALEKSGISGPEEKVRMFEAGHRVMTEAGYQPIGLDHYALPEDELSKAASKRMLHRNFQGYCTRETTGQVYALGSTGISQLDCGYAQNAHITVDYIRGIREGYFPIKKGYLLSEDEKVVRHVINAIMCNYHLSWSQVADDLQLTVDLLKDKVRYAEAVLKEFSDDKLLIFNEDEVTVTDQGRYFVRNIAASFDPAFTNSGKTYSKAL